MDSYPEVYVFQLNEIFLMSLRLARSDVKKGRSGVCELLAMRGWSVSTFSATFSQKSCPRIVLRRGTASFAVRSGGDISATLFSLPLVDMNFSKGCQMGVPLEVVSRSTDRG